MEAETNRSFIAASREVVLLADHTKWGTVGLSTFATWSDLDLVITDPGITPQAKKALQETGCALTIAQ
jgi:DeoR/GlpR family transcriptional regulator of sugar metabolism